MESPAVDRVHLAASTSHRVRQVPRRRGRGGAARVRRFVARDYTFKNFRRQPRGIEVVVDDERVHGRRRVEVEQRAGVRETRVRWHPRVSKHPGRLARVPSDRQPVAHRPVPVPRRLAQVSRVVRSTAPRQLGVRGVKVQTRAVLVDEVLQTAARDERVVRIVGRWGPRRVLAPGDVEVQEPRGELSGGGITRGGAVRFAQVEPPAQVRLQRVHLVRVLKDVHDDVGVDEISSLGVAPRRLARVVHGHRALSLRAVHLLPLRRRPAVAQRPGEVVPRQVRPPRVLVLIPRHHLQDVPAGRDQERDAHDLIRR